MDDQELKAWRCGGGHVLGVVMRSANGVRRMLLYRQAVNLRSTDLLSTDLLSTDLGHGLHGLGNAALGTRTQRKLAMIEGEELLTENTDEHGDGVEEVDVMAVVEGYVMDVRCSICGRLRTWTPGEEVLRRLLEGRREGFGSRKARKDAKDAKREGMVGASGEGFGTRKARNGAKDAKGEGVVGASGAGFGTRKARKEAKDAKGEGVVGASGAGDGRVEG